MLSMSNNKINTFLSIDIGTENLKIALCTVHFNTVEIIGFKKLPQVRGSVRSSFIIDIASVIEKIDLGVGLIISEVKDEYDINLPNTAVFGVAGESVLGKTVHIEFVRKKNNVISESEFLSIVNAAKDGVFESVKPNLAENSLIDEHLLAEVTTELIGIKCDGQYVKEAVGVSAGNIELVFYVAYAPQIYLDSLSKIANKFSLSAFKTFVEPFAISQTLDLDVNYANNCVVVDIGGGTTDVAVMSNKELVGTKIYGIGGNTFTQYIADKLNINFDKAEELKLQYSNQKLTHTEEVELSRIIDKAAYVWARSLELALLKLIDTKELPYNFYFCGGSSLLPNIQQIMISYPWQQKLNFVKYPKFNYLFPNKIKDVVDKTRTVNSLSDVAVMSLASYFVKK